jgi:hypothetical protein
MLWLRLKAMGQVWPRQIGGVKRRQKPGAIDSANGLFDAIKSWISQGLVWRLPV